jgi:hypothetical protein
MCVCVTCRCRYTYPVLSWLELAPLVMRDTPAKLSPPTLGREEEEEEEEGGRTLTPAPASALVARWEEEEEAEACKRGWATSA